MRMGVKVLMWVKVGGMIVLSLIKLYNQDHAISHTNNTFMSPKTAQAFDYAWIFFAFIFPIIVMTIQICRQGDHLEVINCDFTHGHRGEFRKKGVEVTPLNIEPYLEKHID